VLHTFEKGKINFSDTTEIPQFRRSHSILVKDAYPGDKLVYEGEVITVKKVEQVEEHSLAEEGAVWPD
jgi:hypothetical protein